MAGGAKSTNPPRARKRVEVETANASTTTTSLKRAKDGSAFARCDECGKTVPVALISMHSCSLDAKIQMNLDAQVVEIPTEAKKKTVEKRKPSTTTKKPSSKGKKDPSKPKRPPTAFFVFMEEFRKLFKEANPDNKKVSVVAKEGGEKWKSLTEEEKKVYLDRAAELKAEYVKTLETDTNAENDDEEASNDEDDSSEKEAKLETVSDEDGSSQKEAKVETVSDEE